jgi:hypothetical protein
MGQLKLTILLAFNCPLFRARTKNDKILPALAPPTYGLKPGISRSILIPVLKHGATKSPPPSLFSIALPFRAGIKNDKIFPGLAPYICGLKPGILRRLLIHMLKHGATKARDPPCFQLPRSLERGQSNKKDFWL